MQVGLPRVPLRDILDEAQARRLARLLLQDFNAGRAMAAQRAQQEAAAREAQLIEDCVRYGPAVVAALMAMTGFLVLLLHELGTHKADQGSGFSDQATRLRNDGLGVLDDARPADGGWSAEAAESYAEHVRRQGARVAAVAQADLQVAAAVADQAAHVEQGRVILGASIGGLCGAIPVAIGLTAAWTAAACSGSLAALALERVLLAFGMVAIGAAVGATIGVLAALGAAGSSTQQVLDKVSQTYVGVVNDVVSTTPTGLLLA